MLGLNKSELKRFYKLNTPDKIQDFLDSIPFNFETEGETCMSPRRVMREKKANCIEGAMFAATAFLLNKEKPLLLSIKVSRGDFDHCVALYKRNGYWGAISKTNHSVLRFRDPVYKSVRELAMSYFHEYFLVKNGKKTMLGYFGPIDMNKFGVRWIVEEKDLWDIAGSIYKTKHTKVIPKNNKKDLRNASKVEMKSAGIPEWNKKGKRV